FEKALRRHTGNVRRTYERLLKPETNEPSAPFPNNFEAGEAQWKRILAAHHFRDSEAAFRVLKEFALGPGYVHVSPRTMELARQLIPRLLELCPQPAVGAQRSGVSGQRSDSRLQPSPILSDPDRVLTRLDAFIAAYGARASLFELWTSRPAMF